MSKVCARLRCNKVSTTSNGVLMIRAVSSWVSPFVMSSQTNYWIGILLNRLHHTANARHLCGNRQGCLGGTREGVLRDIEDWFTSDQGQCVFWLNGLAGTGKSTIAQTFANGKLGASFFCSRDFEDRSNLQMILPMLAFQLACQYPRFRKELLEVLKQ